jgi:hypothetical protein
MQRIPSLTAPGALIAALLLADCGGVEEGLVDEVDPADSNGAKADRASAQPDVCTTDGGHGSCRLPSSSLLAPGQVCCCLTTAGRYLPGRAACRSQSACTAVTRRACALSTGAPVPDGTRVGDRLCANGQWIDDRVASPAATAPSSGTCELTNGARAANGQIVDGYRCDDGRWVVAEISAGGVPKHVPGTICFTPSFWCWAEFPAAAGGTCHCWTQAQMVNGILG